MPELHCPACGATLPPQVPLAPGQRLQCPRCGGVIPPPAAIPVAIPVEAVPRPEPVAATGTPSRRTVVALAVGGGVFVLLLIVLLLGATQGWFGGQGHSSRAT